MFETKKKLDSKIRFNKSSFQKQLQQARGYKRPGRKIPEKPWEIFLSNVGLNSWLSRIFVAFGLGLLCYIVYVPNFLFIKHINISGLTAAHTEEAKNAINAYFNKKYYPWPQKNWLIFDANELGKYLLAHDQKILKIEAAKKKFPNTLNITLVPRTDAFLIEAGQDKYIASLDGKITADGRTYNFASSTPQGLVKVDIEKAGDWAFGDNILSPDLSRFLLELAAKLHETTGANADNFAIANAADSDLTAQMPAGYKIFFDVKSDLGKVLPGLKLLLAEPGNSNVKNLYYIDLRFGNKAYVCFKNAACARPTVITPQATTTIETSLTPNQP